LLASVFIPMLILGGLEIALRIACYGRSLHFFKKIVIGGREYLVNDDLFALKFFPPEMTRTTSALRMEPQKPPGVFRIFIFGESAAMGDPEPAYGPGRYLEMLLRERYPDQHFEIINVGITAINSHVILPIARECARQQGDLWIVYMGNNEMVGPFGAATVFGAQSPPVTLVRATLAIQETRTGQLLAALGRKFNGKSGNARAWGGMQMFTENKIAPDDRRRETVCRNFEKNLRDIVGCGLDSGTKVLLSTVAVNLKDCPPFASQPVTNLTPADAASYQKAMSNATAEVSQGNFALAEPALEQAEKLAPQSADANYQLGQCQSRLGDAAAACARLHRACDLDTLPFRADSRINGIIADLGRKQNGKRLRWLDAAVALSTNNGLCGEESFYEHVHFNFDGGYRLALAWASQIEAMLPSTMKARSDWASQDICEHRLGLTDWNRLAIVESVIKRLYDPPLSTQPNNAERIAALRARTVELRRRMSEPGATNAARQIYLEALRLAPDDYYLHENYGSFLAGINETEQAISEWRKVHELMPQDFVTDYRLADVLVIQRQFAEAESLLNEALASHPGFTEGWMKLGEAHAAESKLDLALSEYERARKLRPGDATIFYELGRVLSRLKRSPESIASFRTALKMRPDYWEAHYTLGGELGMHDQFQEARGEFEQVVRLQPDYPDGHLNLGVALLKLGQFDEAAREFERTIQLDPGNAIAPTYLRQARVLEHRQ
jgi:tetratricopeptide (TPR) repeat protein